MQIEKPQGKLINICTVCEKKDFTVATLNLLTNTNKQKLCNRILYSHNFDTQYIYIYTSICTLICNMTKNGSTILFISNQKQRKDYSVI